MCLTFLNCIYKLKFLLGEGNANKKGISCVQQAKRVFCFDDQIDHCYHKRLSTLDKLYPLPRECYTNNSFAYMASSGYIANTIQITC